MSFDLQTLLYTDFPDALCPYCAAILCIHELSDGEEGSISCPGCFALLPLTYDNWLEFFEPYPEMRLQMNEVTTLAHARELIAIANQYHEEEIGSLRLLLELLKRSRYFVHFSTYSFTTEMLGLLAETAMRIPVRGLIGESLTQSSDLYKANSIAEFNRVVPELQLTLTGSNTSFEETHTKIYVFDGIVALHGSANLTLNAWKKLPEGRESLDIFTNQAKVRSYNNRFISRFLRRQNLDPNSSTALVS